jgi:hypothetical protein
VTSSMVLLFVSVAHLFSSPCCPNVCFYILSSVLSCPLRFPHKTMFGSRLPSVVCRRADVLLCIVFMFAYIDVQHSAVAHRFSFLCFVFDLFVFVLCRMCLLLLIYLHCPFLISLSGFTNVYLAYYNSVSEWL